VQQEVGQNQVSEGTRTTTQDQAAQRRIGLPVSERKLLMGFGDLVAVNAAVVIALRIWAIVGERSFDLGFLMSQSFWFVLLSVLWVALAAANDFYDLRLTANLLQSQTRLLVITVQLIFIYLMIFFLSPRDALPRLFILYYAAASYVLVAVWRLARPFAIGYAPFRRRVVVAGIGWEARSMIDALKQFAETDYEVVGVIDEGIPAKRGDIVVDADVIGSADHLLEIVEAMNVHELILATGGQIDGVLFQKVMDCYEQGIPVTTMPILYEQLTGMVPVEYARGHWRVLLPLEGRSPFDPYGPLKRLMDIGVSLVGLVVFGLLLPVIALIQRIDSRGPVFYAQERVGKAGKLFKVIKLRTMIPDAEKLSGPIWAASNDSRITRFGRFLRKSRIDEMPQFINILKGDMSLVGPRPERAYFVERLHEKIPFYRTRHAVKPGATGWAQVNYGYGSSDEDSLNKLKYDLYYIRHRSLLLDILIIMRTFGKMFRLEGQ